MTFSSQEIGLDGIYRISVEPAGEYEWKLKETEGLKGKSSYEACFEGLVYWG